MLELTCPELKAELAAGNDLLLIDVREDWERELFNIGGTHLPLGDIIKRKTEIPSDKAVVLYCEKGIRSLIAVQRLQELGFNNLRSLAGGMKAWKTLQ